jgi:phospholipase/carboxylesterase
MNNSTQAISALHQSADFALNFRLKNPVPARPTACVVLLHGVGGSETNLADLLEDLDPQTLVVLPRGPLEMASGQYAWFQVRFTSNGPSIVEAQAEQSRKTLIRFVEQLQSAYNIAPNKTLIAGFSQGGIMSASLGLSAPERVAGFGLLSGRILPELQPHLASKQRLSQLQAFIGHGENDSKLPVLWAQRSDQLLNELGVKHQTRLYPSLDHAISIEMQADFLAWLKSVIATA